MLMKQIHVCYSQERFIEYLQNVPNGFRKSCPTYVFPNSQEKSDIAIAI